MIGSWHKFETHLQILAIMKNRDTTPRETLSDKVFTAVGSDSEKKPDSILKEQVEAQSISYRRSRDVALMKLAFLRPDDDETA
jgi:hypothetical protein